MNEFLELQIRMKKTTLEKIPTKRKGKLGKFTKGKGDGKKQ